MKVTDFSVHLAYSTYPDSNEAQFIESKLEIFKRYSEDTNRFLVKDESINSKMYKPLVYHLFGSYDVVFLSLIDNYKFGQKVFDLDTALTGRSINFQIVTGTCIDGICSSAGKEWMLDLFPNSLDKDEKRENDFKKYINITNFKVNNGLLIGNGLHLIEKIFNKFVESIPRIYKNEKGETENTNDEFIIINSFNWSEITLIQLGDDIKRLQEQVIKLRELSLNQLEDIDDIIKNSLYGELLSKNKLDGSTQEDIKHSDLFVDTHSYSGVDYYKYNFSYENGENPFYEDEFKTAIELQVKPGHLGELSKLLDSTSFIDAKSGEEKNLFESRKLKFKNGKTDFLVKESNNSKFYSNYLVNKTLKDKNSDFKKHIRKVKTNALVDICRINENVTECLDILNYDPEKHQTGLTSFNKILGEEFTIEIKKILSDDQIKNLFDKEGIIRFFPLSDIRRLLPKLSENEIRFSPEYAENQMKRHDLKAIIKISGVSRHLKEKILKAFYNYNNIIQDPILYNEFIDLKGFLVYMLKDILIEVEMLNSYFRDPISIVNKYGGELLNKFSLSEIEDKWKMLLDIFEDAYNNKIHNNYLYEDINEFSIDFNSAINQINAIHDYTVKTFNNVFFKRLDGTKKPKYLDATIVTQNEIESKSNVVNVNYNVYHYLEPTLIFSTLMKEVLNGFEYKVKGYKNNHFVDLKLKIKKESLNDISKVSHETFRGLKSCFLIIRKLNVLYQNYIISGKKQ